MTLPPVLVVGSSFQLWSAGLLPFFIIYCKLISVVCQYKLAFSLYFQGFLGFFRSGFSGLIWCGAVGDIAPAAWAG